MAEPSSSVDLLERDRLLPNVDYGTLRVRESDVLVFGSGIAGLTAALHASVEHSVSVVTKSGLTETNTWYAQGGIAGAVGEADSVDLHVADTLVVGQGLCNEEVVRAVVSEAPEALESLLGFGMRFDPADEGGVALAREGGHSLPRVLHSGDRTGASIQNALTSTLLDRGRIGVFEHRFLVDLLVEGGACVGAIVLDAASGELECFRASAVVLATGGAGRVYRVTTNPPIATGDGVAAAWRAGAGVSDLEFVQFHPTALDHDAAPRFLVSEALRGEGAYLLDCDERRFMLDRHPLAELAPRDVVSREIEQVMARCGRSNVWLDARHLGAQFLRARFPNIWAACAEAGYDLSADLVPVAPAAHYLVGGVKVDVDGRTDLPGLYASGEVAASGLHGANRLASNSLLEGLVFSRRVVRALGGSRWPVAAWSDAPVLCSVAESADGESARQGRSPELGTETIAEVQRTSAGSMAMARTAEGLEQAVSGIAALTRGAGIAASAPALEAANVATVASLIASSAMLRTETRGCHVRLDHPERDDARWLGHIVMGRTRPHAFVPLP